jgi:hypothetical protein
MAEEMVRRRARPEWMSPAVEGLILEWEANGFQLCWPNAPILADALEEAGFSEQKHLETLRSEMMRSRRVVDADIYFEPFWDAWKARDAVFTPALECGVVEGPTFGVQSARGGLSS